MAPKVQIAEIDKLKRMRVFEPAETKWAALIVFPSKKTYHYAVAFLIGS